MKKLGMNRITEDSGETNLRPYRKLCRYQNPPAILDHQHDAGADWLGEFEAEMKKLEMNRITGGFGRDSFAGAARKLAIPESPVRFWIISMMLVLIGLASLKLR